jgi:hypothetical protein
MITMMIMIMMMQFSVTHLQSRFVAGSVYHRLKLPAQASAPLCPGPDVLLRGEGADQASLLGIGGGVGGLMVAAGSLRGAGDGAKDDASVASSSRVAGAAGVHAHEQQLLQKLHTNVLEQQYAPRAFRTGTSAADDGNDANRLDVEVSSRGPTIAAVASSSAAGSSSKVVSWLQASEAAFAEERAAFMHSTVAAASDDDDNDEEVEIGAEIAASQPVLRNKISHSKNGSSSVVGACRVDFERIEMAGGGSLTQPMLLAALRASGTGSMKQVKPFMHNSRALDSPALTRAIAACSCWVKRLSRACRCRRGQEAPRRANTRVF